MKSIKSLTAFISELNRVTHKIAVTNKFPPLDIDVLPIELPTIYWDSRINVITFLNLDQENIFKEIPQKGYMESLTVGINKGLGIMGQIQYLIEIIINSIERSRLKKGSLFANMHNFFARQQEADDDARKYAKKIVNAFETISATKVLEELIQYSKRHLRVAERHRFFQTPESRRRRCTLYLEMYKNLDFVSNFIDNMVAIFFQNPKIIVEGFESYNVGFYSFLEEMFLNTHLKKFFNHLVRDCLIYGDGFIVFKPFFNEVTNCLLHPGDVIIDNNTIKYVPKSLVLRKGEYFQLNLLKWDDSGYGISIVEPLASEYLIYRNIKSVLKGLDQAKKSYDIEIMGRAFETKALALEYLNSIELTMKKSFRDPTKNYILEKNDLYFE